MQFIAEFQDIDISKLRLYLDTCSQSFEDSQLYSGAKKEKFIDLALRMSKFRSIIDPVLFNIADDLLFKLTESNDLNAFTLVRNDITHIKYEPGGFFKEHRDYLSLRSNIIEEYTLLICVTPPDLANNTVGGETRIHVNCDYIHTSQSTIRSGCGLLFRKDLIHEGLILKSGSKEIVSLNIWVTRKQTMNDGILFVTFPETEVNDNIDPIIDAVYGQSYVLSINQILKYPNSILTNYYHFSSGFNNDKIVKYQCNKATYQQFGVIFKALLGMYLSLGEYKDHASILDFFGFGPETLLIDFIGDGKIKSELPELENYPETQEDDPQIFLGLGDCCCNKCGRSKLVTNLYNCIKCKQVQYCSRKCQTVHWNQCHRYECGTQKKIVNEPDFIICPSEERTMMVSQLTTELKRSYIRFRIVFAEGTATFGGEMLGTDPVHLKMAPVWVSIGDYDNIYLQWILMSTGISSDKYIPITDIFADPESSKIYNQALIKGNYPVKLITEDEDEDVDEKEDSETQGLIKCDSYELKIKFNLQVAKSDNINMTCLINSILGDNGEKPRIIPLNAILLPNEGKALYQNKFFHVDQNNKTCFTAQEAELMCKYIEDSDFINRVKGQLNNINFQLPQLMQSNEGDFCNESVYGTFNFIQVTGIVCPERYIS